MEYRRLRWDAGGDEPESAGISFAYREFPEMPHSMHGHDPARYVATVTHWIDSLNFDDDVDPRSSCRTGPGLIPGGDQLAGRRPRPAPVADAAPSE
jgi:hypothetical protein